MSDPITVNKRLMRNALKRCHKLDCAAKLIKKAADAEIICMPDSNHVLLAVDGCGDDAWKVVTLLEAAVSLTNSGYFRELKKAIAEKTIV